MKILFRVIGIFYLSVLFYIFFLARRRPHVTFFQHKEEVKLIPLKNKLFFLQAYNYILPSDRWIFYTDLFGNIAIFIPLPFFLVMVFHVKSYWKIILIACASSLCVECIQFIFSIGVADIDDVILNTLGAAIGLVVVSFTKKIIPSIFPATI